MFKCNYIVDITPLSGLTNLQALYLYDNNKIVDITALSELTNLEDLRLEYNQIVDISPLLGCLYARDFVSLGGNPLNDAAPSIIAELRSRGVRVYL